MPGSHSGVRVVRAGTSTGSPVVSGRRGDQSSDQLDDASRFSLSAPLVS